MDNGTYQIDVSWNGQLLEMTISGEATKDNGDAIALDVIRLVVQHKPDLLFIDVRKVKGRLGIIDTYFHVRDYPRPPHPVTRAAILELPENKDYYVFHETTARNAGMNVRYFVDFDEAMAWLQPHSDGHPEDSGPGENDQRRSGS